MSFLDLDEWLLWLAQKADMVYGPLMDVKIYPENVDLVLVEGAVANEEHLEMIRTVRDRSRYLIAFGDCAVTGNVTAIRNVFPDAETVLQRSYQDVANLNPQVPASPGIVPLLLAKVKPVHQVVAVDLYLPGCPPPADRIQQVLEALLAGKAPAMVGREMIQFG